MPNAAPHLTEGYHLQPSLLSDEECLDLLGWLESTPLPAGRAGVRHLMKTARIQQLAQDPRLVDLATSLLGEVAIPFKATLFGKSSLHNWLIAWHQDTALPLAERFDADGWGPWSLKDAIPYAHAPTWALNRVVALRVHLDDSAEDNGPLRVIPRSQNMGVLTSEEAARHSSTAGFQECHAPRGGVIAMSPLIIHASSKMITERPRRVLHIEYAGSLDLAPGIRLAIA